MSVVLGFHIIGAAMWMVGAMILCRILRLFLDPAAATPALHSLVRAIFFGFVVAGMAISLTSGMLQLLSYRGPDSLVIYMRQGWFHAKLTLVFLGLIATAILWSSVNKLQHGGVVTRGRLVFLHSIFGSVLLTVVMLTMVRLGF